MQKSEGRVRQHTGNNSNMFASAIADQQNHLSVPLFSDKMMSILKSEQPDLDDNQHQEESIMDDDEENGGNRMIGVDQ